MKSIKHSTQFPFLFLLASGAQGLNQSIQDHDVEHRQDIERIWALGFHEPDPFPAAEDTERENEGDELVSVV